MTKNNYLAPIAYNYQNIQKPNRLSRCARSRIAGNSANQRSSRWGERRELHMVIELGRIRLALGVKAKISVIPKEQR